MSAYNSPILASQNTNDELKKVVVFMVGKHYYCVDIMKIPEVINFRELTPIADTPDYVLGLIVFQDVDRDVVVPIIDLRQRLSKMEPVTTPDTRIILYRTGNDINGLVVDKAAEVIQYRSSDILDTPHQKVLLKQEYIHYFITHNERLIIYVDLDKILNAEEKMLLQEIRNAHSEGQQ